MFIIFDLTIVEVTLIKEKKVLLKNGINKEKTIYFKQSFYNLCVRYFHFM